MGFNNGAQSDVYIEIAGIFNDNDTKIQLNLKITYCFPKWSICLTWKKIIIQKFSGITYLYSIYEPIKKSFSSIFFQRAHRRRKFCDFEIKSNCASAPKSDQQNCLIFIYKNIVGLSHLWKLASMGHCCSTEMEFTDSIIPSYLYIGRRFRLYCIYIVDTFSGKTILIKERKEKETQNKEKHFRFQYK